MKSDGLIRGVYVKTLHDSNSSLGDDVEEIRNINILKKFIMPKLDNLCKSSLEVHRHNLQFPYSYREKTIVIYPPNYCSLQ